MDDRTAFELQVGEEIGRIVGPALPVDDVAIFEVAANQSKGWGISVVSALKLAAAAAIVALFGGFLLAGMLSTPQDGEVLPATTTESPPPTTAEELLAGMVISEVEPGVFRIVNDGMRDVVPPVPGSFGPIIAVGDDGSVWVLPQDEDIYRLGGDSIPWPLERELGTFVSRDGRLWNGLNTTDGQGWTKQPPPPADRYHDLWHVGDTVWAAWPTTAWAPIDPNEDGPYRESSRTEAWTVARFDEGVWHPLEPLAEPSGGHIKLVELFTTDGGDLWAWTESGGSTSRSRWDGDRWTRTATYDVSSDSAEWPLAMQADGTLWTMEWQDDGEVALRSFDGVEWREMDYRYGDFGFQFPGNLRYDFAPDGSLWIAASHDLTACAGVARFEAAHAHSYLDGVCAREVHIGPDGAVWVVAGTEPAGALYVITPKALTAVE